MDLSEYVLEPLRKNQEIKRLNARPQARKVKGAEEAHPCK